MLHSLVANSQKSLKILLQWDFFATKMANQLNGRYTLQPLLKQLHRRQTPMKMQETNEILVVFLSFRKIINS